MADTEDGQTFAGAGKIVILSRKLSQVVSLQCDCDDGCPIANISLEWEQPTFDVRFRHILIRVYKPMASCHKESIKTLWE